MKSTGIIALVAAGVVAGAGVAAHELTKPSSDPLRVNYVQPAATTTTAPTVTPTVAPKVSPSTTTTTKAPVAVTSSSTTHKAAVQKEATVANTPAPSASTTPPAPNDPIRSVAPPPIPGNGPQISGDAPAPTGTK